MENKRSIFGTVPFGWTISTIGEVFELRQGLQILKKQRTSKKESNNIPLLKITDLPNNEFSEYVKDVNESYVANEEDIIYTRTGQVGLVYTNVKGCVHNNCFKVIYDNKKFDKSFVYYLLNNDIMRLNSNNIASGSVQKDLTHKAFKLVNIAYPTLEKQKKIGRILNSLDNKIKLNNEMNRTLEEMAQAVFKSWFVDFEPFKEGEFEESELGMIPKGWKLSTIGDEVTIIGGGTPKTSIEEYWNSDDILWATPTDLTAQNISVIDSTAKYISNEGLKKSSAKLLPMGSVIMTSRATIGYCAITQRELSTNQGFINIVCDKTLSNCYILYWIKRNVENIIGLANGSTFKEISKGTFKGMKVIVPEETVLSNYNKNASELINRIYSLKKENDLLKQMRDTLLPKLISGEIQV